VQFYALSVLDLLERIKEINDDDRQLRLAMISSGNYDADALFPEVFAKVVDDDDAELPAEVDSEGNPIATRYDFSNATYDPKAVEEEIAGMLARAAQAEASLDMPQYDEWV
jgi:hypothetical protein